MRALYDRAAALARLYGYRYVETPVFESTELFARTSGETQRRRDQGDVHVRGSTRPLAHAPPRGDRAGDACLPRGDAGTALAVQGVLPDAHVSLRAPAGGPVSRASAVRHRSVRRGGPGGGCRGDHGRGRVPPGPRARPGRAPVELHRRRGLPARIPRRAARLPPSQPGSLARRAPRSFRGQPAPRPGLQGRRLSRGREGGAEDHRPAVRSVPRPLRRCAVGPEGCRYLLGPRTDAGAGIGLLHADRVRVRESRACRRSKRRCSEVAATTGLPRCSAGRTFPASGSGWVWSGC